MVVYFAIARMATNGFCLCSHPPLGLCETLCQTSFLSRSISGICLASTPASFGFIRPEIPTLVPEQIPERGCRIKHDGYRTLISSTPARSAFSRHGRDWTGPYRRDCARLSCNAALIDGEILVQDENGISDFHALRSAIHTAPHRLVFLAAFGNALVLPQGMAGDAILKAAFASFAFENYEIAAYRSLITMTELVRMRQFRTPLEASLNEELRMAQWLGDNIPAVTRRYLAEVEGGRPANSAFLTQENLGAIVREHKPHCGAGPS